MPRWQKGTGLNSAPPLHDVEAVSRSRVVARGAMLVAAAALPFELAWPLARVGPLQLSSVELPLYVALALWLASYLVGAAVRWRAGGLPSASEIRRRLRAAPRVYVALASFCLVLVVSAVLAPVFRGAAVKFALRSLGGVA